MTAGALWAIVAALWLGCLLPGPGWLGPLAAAGLAATLRSRLLPAVRLLGALAAMVALGSGLAGARVGFIEHGPLSALAARGGEAHVAATVVTDPQTTEFGAWFLVRVNRLDGRGVRERALLRLDPTVDAPLLGADLAFTATARPLERDGFDGYLRRLHAGVRLDAVTPVTTTAPPNAVLRGAETVRSRVRDAARQRLPPDHAALLAGLVTGDTAGMSEAAETAMMDAGLSHLVAVSGANVALVLAGVLGIAAACGVGARGRRRAGLAALVWFVILVRAEPSVLRATVMAVLVLAAGALGRGQESRHTLAAAALLLLLLDPQLGGQPGFALSVLATGGVLVIAPAIAERLRGPRAVRQLVAASAGAQLGVSPVLVAIEGAVPLASLPANLVAVPAAMVASAIGVVAALVAQLSAAAGGWLALLARPALATVLWAGRRFASGPQLTPADVLAEPATAALVLGGLALVLVRHRPRMAAVVVVVAVAVGGLPLGRPGAVPGLTLTALDVGQGDALLVEAPGPVTTARMLVDGGPDPDAALTLLRRRGVDRLDAVVVSHPHSDHTNGLPAVLSRLPVGALLVGPRTLPEQSASAVATIAVARQRGVAIVPVAAGERFDLGTARVEVLSPPADGSLGAEPNDNSVVLRASSADGALLLTGDAEVAAQALLLRRPDLLAANVVKMPHHGGDTNDPRFLEAVGAATAVVSVGEDNDYGHPTRSALQQLGAARVLRTDVDGTVTVLITGP